MQAGNSEKENVISWKVLCVDDEPSILRSLRRILPKQNYQVFTAESGQDGLNVLHNEAIDLVISDMRMPRMSGAEFLEQVAKLYPDTVRILLTGYSDMESTIAAVNRGRIHRYLEKPWDTQELLECLGHELESKRLKRENEKLTAVITKQNEELKYLNASLESKVEQRTKQIRKTLDDLQKSHQQVKEQVRAIIRVFYNLMTLKGTQGSAYSKEISQLCLLLAARLKLSDLEQMNIKLAGLLSEVGVLCLDDRLSSKPLYFMNIEEKAEFQTHAALAFRAMSPVQHLSSIAHSVAHQFERFDGKGNTSSLKGDELPMGSRILSLARDYIYAIRGVSADVRLSSSGAIQQLNEKAGIIYDPALIEHLVAVIPDLEVDHLEQDEQVISILNLSSGMKLSRDVITNHHLLLLPEGHILNAQTIKRIQSYAASANEILRIYVFTQDDKGS